MKQIFALVDCNNFYASCERVFNPGLQGKPVIVLSNNDGCVVARSDEAKALKIAMGVPAFEIADIIEKNHVQVFSSNYALYDDMSSRVMDTLSTFSPDIEIYSIDEAFLNLAGLSCSLTHYGQKIRQTVGKWTGMPVSIGIAQTKTLAKTANYIAKHFDKTQGVLDLTDSTCLDRALAKTPVEKIWGVGIKTAVKLKRAGIDNALKLRDTDAAWVRQRFTVTGERTVYELRGCVCYQLEQNPPTRKTLVVSRMFSTSIEAVEALKEAIAAYACRAGERLRKEHLAAGAITVFVATSRFVKNRYYNCRTTRFDVATNNTTELIRNACKSIETLYRKGAAFKKCGVVLSDLVPENRIQPNLFDNTDRQKSARLMRTIDTVNAAMDCPLRWAAEGLNQPWKLKFHRRSPRYTTRWDEIPKVV
ncbi:MAG TPA: Y-family DNA polymerase [Planctomycetes bacterium]|nr:Y-family DNA polymerase [Planctomycetota bacterium]HIJ72056.1 Y-family DNA polymerase [Planctomycetota bacterium]